MLLYTALNDVVKLTLATSYTAGSGQIVLSTGQGAVIAALPTRVTVIAHASYGQGSNEVQTIFGVTGRTGDTLTGVVAIEGTTDRNYGPGDYLECRMTAGYINDVNTAFGASMVTVATESSLVGSRRLVAGTNVTFVDAGAGSTLTINAVSTSAPGGGNGQIQYNNSGSLAGFSVSGDGTINTSTGALTVLRSNGVPFALSATTDTTNAGNITSGTLPAAQLPLPTTTTLGGVRSSSIVPSKYLTSINSSGTTSSAQPAFTDISGQAALAQLPTVAASTLLGNPTGAGAVPALITLGTNLSFAGSVLNAAGGGGTPGGSPGQFQYDNAGAFGGAANLTLDANSCANLTAIADPATPVASSIWTSTSTGGLSFAFAPAVIGRIGGTIFSCGSCAQVVNTATPTSLFGTPTNVAGSRTIKANTLTVGKLLRWQIGGIYTATGTPTLTIAIKLGATQVLVANLAALTAQVNLGWGSIGSWLGFTAVGAGGGCIGVQQIIFAQPATISSNTGFPAAAGGAGPISVATNVDLAFDIVVTWSSANPSNWITLLFCTLEMQD